jgi:hypothetical protein
LVGGKNILVVFHENSKKDPNDPNVPKPNNPQIRPETVRIYTIPRWNLIKIGFATSAMLVITDA